MYEFLEYPKMIYHPETNAQVIVASREAEDDQEASWQAEIDAPVVPLRGRKASVIAASEPVSEPVTASEPVTHDDAPAA